MGLKPKERTMTACLAMPREWVTANGVNTGLLCPWMTLSAQRPAKDMK